MTLVNDINYNDGCITSKYFSLGTTHFQIVNILLIYWKWILYVNKLYKSLKSFLFWLEKVEFLSLIKKWSFIGGGLEEFEDCCKVSVFNWFHFCSMTVALAHIKIAPFLFSKLTILGEVSKLNFRLVKISM